MKRILLIILLAGIISCEKTDELAENLGSNSGIIGTWVEAELDEAFVETHRLKRSRELAQDKYGFIIKEDGSFTERKNAGWCGTPPITYDNFEGQWMAKSDTILEITVGYWGGVMSYEMKIIALDSEFLEVEYMYNAE